MSSVNTQTKAGQQTPAQRQAAKAKSNLIVLAVILAIVAVPVVWFLF